MNIGIKRTDSTPRARPEPVHLTLMAFHQLIQPEVRASLKVDISARLRGEPHRYRERGG